MAADILERINTGRLRTDLERQVGQVYGELERLIAFEAISDAAVRMFQDLGRLSDEIAASSDLRESSETFDRVANGYTTFLSGFEGSISQDFHEQIEEFVFDMRGWAKLFKGLHSLEEMPDGNLVKNFAWYFRTLSTLVDAIEIWESKPNLITKNLDLIKSLRPLADEIYKGVVNFNAEDAKLADGKTVVKHAAGCLLWKIDSHRTSIQNTRIRPPSRSLQEYLEDPERGWVGDDLEECFRIVKETRSRF